MKFTNTEVETLLDRILFDIKYYKEGNEDAESTIDNIEEVCANFKDNYICPYEKYTAEWYDEHGE